MWQSKPDKLIIDLLIIYSVKLKIVENLSDLTKLKAVAGRNDYFKNTFLHTFAYWMCIDITRMIILTL